MKKRKLKPVEEDDDDAVVIPHDPRNEQVVLSAALVDKSTRKRLLRRLQPDTYIVEDHQIVWTALRELERRKLEYDPATLHNIDGRINPNYVEGLIEARPEVPANLEYHVQVLLWDHKRLTGVRGPVAHLLKLLRNPRSSQDAVVSAARQVSLAFEGSGDRQFMVDSASLVAAQEQEIKKRQGGIARYPFGIKGFDQEPDGKPILLPGAAPGMTTVVTGISGAGKTVFMCHLVLGLARQKRRVLVASFEMKCGLTLELLAIISLGYSRTAFLTGQFTERERVKHAERMAQISKYVVFMTNPYGRLQGDEAAERAWERSDTNNKRLEVLRGYIADAGCDVVAVDLWRRILKNGDPDSEEAALYRQQDMFEELGVHGILLQQQNLEKVESSPDKRPRREYIKNSKAWVEIADNMFGINRPALWKGIDDNVFEVHILKQRHGKWPMLVEFDWSGDRAQITDGKLVPYEYGNRNENENVFEPPKRGRGKGRH